MDEQGILFQRVPYDLKNLIQIQENAIKNVSLLPFSLEELQWLSLRRQEIVCMQIPTPWNQQGDQEFNICKSDTTRLLLQPRDRTSIGIITRIQKIIYHVDGRIYQDFDYVHMERDLDLASGWDSQLDLIAESNYPRIQDFTNPYQHYFYILDVASIFQIFFQRYSILDVSDPLKFAREGTLQALESFVGYFSTFPYPFENYVKACLTNLGEAVSDDYELIMNDETFERVVGRCDKYLVKLAEIVRNLQ